MLAITAAPEIRSDYRELWAELDAEQELVNRAAAYCSPALIRRLIERLADRRHAPYAQYRAYWHGAEWNLGMIRRDIVGKGGRRFAAGDVVIFRRELSFGFTSNSVTAYSVRGEVNCSVYSGDVEEVTA